MPQSAPSFTQLRRSNSNVVLQVNRPSASKRGYNYRWVKYSHNYLSAHPLCVICEAKGKTTAATVVDHIVPHKGSQELFWDVSNHQSLCASCHGRKTAREDGGFGNRKKKRVE